MGLSMIQRQGLHRVTQRNPRVNVSAYVTSGVTRVAPGVDINHIVKYSAGRGIVNK